MLRQSAPPDPELVLGRELPPPPPPPPVVHARREEPPVDPPAAFIPVVRKGAAVAVVDVPPSIPEPAERVAETRTTEEIRAALRQPCSGLFGAAGSGKTFLTKAWADDERGLVLAATTGIAAINLGGETINSILGYFDTASLQE